MQISHHQTVSGRCAPVGQAKPRAIARVQPRSETVACRAVDQETSRRDVLLAGALTAVSPLIIVKGAGAATAYLEVDNLSSFQRTDQRNEFVARAQSVLKEILTPEDAPACVRLALHDAGTYDIVTKTGGFDGSIILSEEELGRPENSTLTDIVAKLKQAKTKIDEGDTTGAGPISWADTIYLAGKVSTQKLWEGIKMGRAETPSGGKVIATAFRNPWEVVIGRVDNPTPGTNRLPALDADVEEIRQYLLKLGAKPGAGSGPFTPKPPFWERPGFVLWTAAALDPLEEEKRFVLANTKEYTGIKRMYDQSRRTVTRTDYEMDFADFYNKMCSLGATFNKSAYLYRIPVQKLV